VRTAATAAHATLLLALFAADVAAQGSTTLRGRAVDPQGQPVGNAEVVLHRVGSSGGARVAVDTTDADGNFSLSTAETADSSAVYFAATRQNENLYVGEFVRPPLEQASPYELLVGGQPFSMDTPVPTNPPASSVPAVATPSSRRFLLFLVPFLGLVGVAAWLLAHARPAGQRRLFIRMAVLDEEAGPNGLGPAEQRERDRILERLLAE
jgi:hypothetical protein